MPELHHYRCAICGWTWGDERGPNETRCPVEGHHKGLLRAKRKRAKAKAAPTYVSAGSVLAMALGRDQ